MGARASTGRAVGRASAEVARLQQAKPAELPPLPAPPPPTSLAVGGSFEDRNDALVEAMGKLRIVQRTEVVDPKKRQAVEEVVALSARKGLDRWSQLPVEARATSQEAKAVFREAREGVSAEELAQRYNAPVEIVQNALKFSSLPRIRELRDDVGRKYLVADA